MSVEIIYEKTYPHIDFAEALKEADALEVEEVKEPPPSFNEVLKKIYANTAYILMPERIKACEDFIKVAIEVSETYEIDTRIERRLDHVSVDYSFDCGGGMHDIGKVFGMADQFSFFKDINGRDITISMDFFTHAVVRNGRIVNP